MPTLTESAAALLRRLHSAPQGKNRRRLPALYVVASGQARHRQDVARALGVHQHSVAVWGAASAAGGVEQARRYDGPQPPRPRRLTDTALTAPPAQPPAPAGFASSGPSRPWVAAPPQGQWSSSRLYAVVRGELRAQPTRPRPAHAQKVQRP